MLMVACGGSSGMKGNINTPPGTYNVTITAQSGATTQTVSLKVIVQ
jgi:uncharacterized membrane protein